MRNPRKRFDKIGMERNAILRPVLKSCDPAISRNANRVVTGKRLRLADLTKRRVDRRFERCNVGKSGDRLLRVA